MSNNNNFLLARLSTLWGYAANAVPKGIRKHVLESMNMVGALIWGKGGVGGGNSRLRQGAFMSSNWMVNPRLLVDPQTGKVVQGNSLRLRVAKAVTTTVAQGGHLSFMLTMQVNSATHNMARARVLESRVRKVVAESERGETHVSECKSARRAFRRLLLKKETNTNYPSILIYFKMDGRPRKTRLEMRAARKQLMRW
jgi:hypothetical protein